jgi:hypothetical protein
MTEVSNDADGIEKRIQGGLCSVEEMATLVGSSVAIDRLIAAQSGASTDILETLSQSSDSATREAVTGNPGTPRELLTGLAWDVPRALLLNPAFDLMIFDSFYVAVATQIYPPGPLNFHGFFFHVFFKFFETAELAIY